MEDEQNWLDLAGTMFTPAPQSIADTLLAKVFGNWIFGDTAVRGIAEGPTIYNNFLGLDEVTLVSTILGYSGILAAAFGLIISSYTFLMQMVKNSWNGSFASDGVNSIFWPLRSVAAFALIIPVVTIGNPDTGRTTQIATAQIFMMDIARAGSAFADTVSGVYVTNAFSFPISNHRPPDTPRAVFEMLKIASCTVIGAHTEGKSYPEFAQVATTRDINGKVVTYIAGDRIESANYNAWKQEFSGTRKKLSVVGSIETALTSAFSTENLESIAFGNNGACGKIDFKSSKTASRSNTKRTNEKSSAILSELQDRVSSTYWPLYSDLAVTIFRRIDTAYKQDAIEKIVYEAPRMDAAESQEAIFYYEQIELFNINLYTAIQNEMNAMQDQLGGSMFKPIIDGGWAALGAVYSVIPRISNIAVNNMSDAHGQIQATPSSFPCTEGSFFSLSNEDCTARNLSMGYIEAAVNLTKKYRSTYANVNRPQVAVLDYCTIDQCSLRSIQSGTAKAISTTLLSVLAETGQWGNTSRATESSGFTNAETENQDSNGLRSRGQENAQDANPVATLSAIGSSMSFIGAILQASVLTIDTIGNAVSVMSNAGGVSGTLAGVFLAPVVAVIELGSGFLVSMSQVLLVSGFFLSYILPMLPFMIFSMQVIGWLATTAEGMFAVTFAVALLTNSDGDGAINTGFLKALSLTAAIFLKPFFIVVGVALAHAIAAPAFSFFNDQFWLAWDMDAALGGNVSNVLFEMSAQLILYIVGASILVKFIYSIQHIVPDSMNNWISGGIVNPFGVQGVADGIQTDLKGNVSKVTESAAGAVSASAKKQNESRQPPRE
jgi:conjugal transfer/type IV secretion protein DotA/TraY